MGGPTRKLHLVILLRPGSEYLELRPEVNVNVRNRTWFYSCICRAFTLTSGCNARYSEPGFRAESRVNDTGRLVLLCTCYKLSVHEVSLLPRDKTCCCCAAIVAAIIVIISFIII